MLDGICRATQRGDSTHSRRRTELVAHEVLNDSPRVESGEPRLAETRREVEQGWRAMSETLAVQGHPEFAAEVRGFIANLPPVRTGRDHWILAHWGAWPTKVHSTD